MTVTPKYYVTLAFGIRVRVPYCVYLAAPKNHRYFLLLK